MDELTKTEVWLALEERHYCSICLSVLVLPVYLQPCSHVVCLECAKALYESRDSNSLYCPLCRGRVARIEEAALERALIYREACKLSHYEDGLIFKARWEALLESTVRSSLQDFICGNDNDRTGTCEEEPTLDAHRHRFLKTTQHVSLDSSPSSSSSSPPQSPSAAMDAGTDGYLPRLIDVVGGTMLGVTALVGIVVFACARRR